MNTVRLAGTRARSRGLIRRHAGVLFACGTAVALGVLGVGLEAAGRADASRYPYDPVCAWGRVANGKGMLVRCLSQHESLALRSASASTASGKTSEGDQAGTPRGQIQMDVTVGPVLVDQGKLPQAESKLRAAKDRYAQCVQQHGGLTRAEGEVRVRFLVRERGRAEGVGVAKRRSVSAEAAQCVADVVDRRHVGLPDAEIIAATVVIKFRRKQQ